MNVIVCVKLVLDSEELSPNLLLDQRRKKKTAPYHMPYAVNPYDNVAVEAALRICEKHGDQVIAISMGHDLKIEVLREILDMGVDKLILIEDENFIESDVWVTASVLTMAIKKIADFDFILCGKQDCESEAGQVGLFIANNLNLPCVTGARNIELIIDEQAIIERSTDDGYEVIKVDLPAVITVSEVPGGIRAPIVEQSKKTRWINPLIWNRLDLLSKSEQDNWPENRVKRISLFKPIREFNI